MSATTRRFISAACLALAAACLPLSTHAAEDPTVVSVAAKTPELSTFYSLVQQAGLTAALELGEVTVFAPTNDAFKAVPAATLDKLAKDPELLKSVLSYHVLPRKVPAGTVEGSLLMTTVNGAKVSVSRAGDFVTVDEAMVVVADMPAGKSVIHEIDRVLMPAQKK